MKKAITIILFCSFLLCSTSIAENADVVGAWYANIESDSFPDPDSMEDITRAIMIATFTETGEIHLLEVDYRGTKAELTDLGIVGKWEKVGNDYYTSVVAVGKEKVIFEDGLLYASLFNNKTYFGLRKMEPFDAYYNILIK